MDETVTVTQARAEFADLMNRAAYGGERIVVTRHGRPIGALISAADLERLERLDREQEAGEGTQIVRLGGGPVGEAGAPSAFGGHGFGLAAHHQPPTGREQR
ncbi:hypothetical protein AMIS_42240 [Actinoplanes missouriensis 431]|uniref:Antitoxin n=1 Tax=Actinoplanes missouriensis (strain ATCC 14538 / DSM 43046 / CBS 188.64 / JCM 3121 / NBRC 102363 / NCIMB 12654 / NRRL B-3342 / UNCC 431) TaxID=512565 RepID=I0H8V7_ACTM4|nr:type II toxin-antitoxin system Phd/YefM family antitoxin [Actinoplanes missouriensis]BAL89444.1 hypothetical protein AMIS_42240 [Actinoplanes missouriensis 431]